MVKLSTIKTILPFFNIVKTFLFHKHPNLAIYIPNLRLSFSLKKRLKESNRFLRHHTGCHPGFFMKSILRIKKQ